MMEVRTINLEEVIKSLSDAEKKQIPFAVARALTDISKVGKDNLTKQLTEDFNNPKTFTRQGAYGGMPVGKGETSTEFGIKDRQAEYLEAEVFGGSRDLRPFETRFNGRYLVPTDNATKDSRGNVPLEAVKQIMANAKARANGYYVTDKQIRYRAKGQESKAIYNIVDKAPVYTPVISLQEAADEAINAWPEAFASRFAQAMASAK